MQFTLIGPRSRRREPVPRTMIVVPAVVGAAAGAVVEYLLDPARGRARRAQLRERSAAMVRRPAKRVRRVTEQKVTYLRGRTRGAAHGMTTPTEPIADDRTLTDKVRSEALGDRRFARYGLNVDAVDGVVTLRGQVDDPDTIRDVVAAVERVPGVRRVENLLHTPQTPAPNVKGLQQPGASPR